MSDEPPFLKEPLHANELAQAHELFRLIVASQRANHVEPPADLVRALLTGAWLWKAEMDQQEMTLNLNAPNRREDTH